jgi:kynureninase
MIVTPRATPLETAGSLEVSDPVPSRRAQFHIPTCGAEHLPAWHGLNPDDAVIRLRPRDGEHHLRTQDVLAYFRESGEAVAVSLLGGVNYRTGAVLDMAAITRAAREAGCVAGWDLAHAVGNVPLRLHEWGADFAVWCTYKYLNGGPGSVGGAFVHDRHAGDPGLVRLGGWWGNDSGSRFEMRARFDPGYGAAGWQISNPPLLAMAPLLASLALFDEIGLDPLRGRSRRLSEYLDEVLDEVLADQHAAELTILTPREHAARGCQVSIRIPGRASAVCEQLLQRGVVCDHRGDSVLRVAPVPLYSTYTDIVRLGAALLEVVRAS